ncbi:alpha/beta hydrolase [Desulforhopalus sp. 52FAK]
MKYSFTIVLLFLALTGCQPKVYLMPPPVTLLEESDFFDFTEDSKDDNLLYTLYATNRHPFNRPDGSLGYTVFPSDSLRLGFVVHSVGDEGTTWDELKRSSLSSERDKKLLLKQVYARERIEYEEDDDIMLVSSAGEGTFDVINRALDRAFDTDLVVYVHGANSSFYRATAQGAQFYHFTGHNSIVLTFSWPSAENLLKYKTDVHQAKKTIPVFAKLIEILAAHTHAKNINIVAYSAGAQVVVPGLAYLRAQHGELGDEELKEKFRIGEVYFAAPDMDFSAFCDDFLKFKDIVFRTTINLNKNDSVLRLSAFQNGVSRLGRPDGNDITDEEKQILIEELQTPSFNILDVGASEALNLGGSHNSWYSHPWVSNDLLLLLLFHGTPEDRGLVRYYYDSGVVGYLFPSDYEEKLKNIIQEKKDELAETVLQ